MVRQSKKKKKRKRKKICGERIEFILNNHYYFPLLETFLGFSFRNFSYNFVGNYEDIYSVDEGEKTPHKNKLAECLVAHSWVGLLTRQLAQ